jgi:hydroxyethylthiazole kinase-like sugar kinase family protein
LELYFHSLRFNLLKVNITGRNLVAIHEMLKQHRVNYIRENASEVDDFEEKQIYIEGVRVEEVE